MNNLKATKTTMKELTRTSFFVKITTCLFILGATFEQDVNCQQQSDSQPAATSSGRPNRLRRPTSGPVSSENNEINSGLGVSIQSGSASLTSPLINAGVETSNQQDLIALPGLSGSPANSVRPPTSSSNEGLPVGSRIGNGRRKPARQEQFDDEQPVASTRPVERPAQSGRKKQNANKKPSTGSRLENVVVERDEYESEDDCDDENLYYHRGGSGYYYDDADYYDLYDTHHPSAWQFGGLMRNPVRQFTRLFEDALDHVPDFSYGSLGRTRNGNRLSASSASASNSDPSSYSRIQSSVTKNGKTKGVITETRNGRTQTKRFGEDEENEDEESSSSQDY